MWLHIVFVFLFFFMGYSQTAVNRSCTVVETILPGSIYNVVFVNDMIAFMLTTANTIFRTSDGGVNWIDQSSILPDWMPGNTGVTIMVQSLNPFLIYFAGNQGDIWITTDGGAHYRHDSNLFGSGYITYVNNIFPHPTNATFVACDMVFCESVSECFTTIIFSEDAGTTWSAPGQYSYNDILTWGPAGSPGHLDTEFYGLYYFLDTAVGIAGGFQATSNLSTFSRPFGDNQFASLYYAAGLDAFFLLSYVPTVELYQVPTSTLNNPTLQKEVFHQTKKVTPIDNIAVVDSSPGSIIMAVHKSQQPNNSLEIFVSNSLNGQFQLSLDNVYATSYPPVADILKLEGGIFLANRWINPTSLQTVVSSNKGENWTAPTPPANEMQNCNNCTLQFFGESDFTGGINVQTVPLSSGVILGLAMVGPQLVNDPSLANLYISRDSGTTWTKLQSGSWKFDASATTGFIALAPFQTPATQLLYTFDEGESWSTCSIKPSTDTRDLYVDLVSTSLVAPLQNTGVWVATHWNNSKGVTSYSIIFAQFNTSFHSCGPSDYEVVSEDASDCVLGQQTLTRRKKGSSVCKVNTSMNLTFTSPCNCTRNDYTCAHCFMEAPNGVCLLNDSVVCNSLENPPAVCPPGSNYSAPIGYVRVQGTKCINDLPIFTPNQQPCPSIPAPHSVTPLASVPNPESVPNSDSVPTSGPVSTPTSGPVSTPTSGPVSTPTSGPTTPTSSPATPTSSPTTPTSSPTTPTSGPISISLPSPSPFIPLNSSDSSADSDNSLDRVRQAGFIALGVILGIIVLVVIIILVVKFCTTPAAVDQMELS